MAGYPVVLVAALVSMGVLAVLTPVVERGLGRNTGYPLAAGFLGVAVALGWEAPAVLAGHPVAASWPWIPGIGVSLTVRLDGLTLLFSLLILGVGAMIMAYCPRYLPVGGPHRLIYFLLTLFGGAMLGLVLAGDLVLMVVFWELTSVISFFLIGAPGARSVRPAVRALLVTGAGGLALLVAVVLLAIVTGTTDLATILAAPQRVLASPLAPAVAALLIVAAFTKSAQVPFHFWLPGAMVAITPVSAYLHAATMVKAGIYLLLRFSTLYAGRPGWSLTLTGIGLFTAVLGAVTALRQHDLKALLAYSTVSQLGLLVAAIGVGTTVALAAAILHTFAHALFKATLFMLVGVIDREVGSRDIRELSGLMRVMPVTATLTGLAAMSLAGLPPVIGFVSKESLFEGFAGARAFPGAGAVFGALAITASMLTFAYGVRIFYGAFAGPTLQRRLYEPAWAFLAPAGVAAVAGAVLGPAVLVLNPLMHRAISDVEPWGRPPSFALWHGFGPALLMTGVTITCGTGLFLARDRVDHVLRRLPPLGGEGLFDRACRGVSRLGAAVGRTAHGDSTRVYLAPPVAALVLLGGVAAFGALGRPVPSGPPSGPMDWAVLGLLVAAVAGLRRARSVPGTVALVGMVGLIVTTWFILAGAPDVALTLVLVEVLTALVAAFVLRGLPQRLPRPDRRGRRVAAGLAALAGAAATAGALTLTGRREPSPAGWFFIRAAQPRTGGSNVVNTILVDFRGLDTLGESSVLTTVALGLWLLRLDAPGRRGAPYGTLLGPAYRLLAPVIMVLSAYLFLRGHDEPGGGFIAALVAGLVVTFASLVGRAAATGPWSSWSGRLLPAGLTLAVATGLAATTLGRPFFTPLTMSLPGGIVLSSSQVFDFGVYLMVLGLTVTAVDRFGPVEAGRP